MELYTSGLIVDIALAVVALELVVLAVVFRRTGRGIPPIDAVPNLASAVFLLLAVRNETLGQPWILTAVFLAASFPAHLLDLRRRWNKSPRTRKSGVETRIAPADGDR